MCKKTRRNGSFSIVLSTFTRGYWTNHDLLRLGPNRESTRTNISRSPMAPNLGTARLCVFRFRDGFAGEIPHHFRMIETLCKSRDFYTYQLVWCVFFLGSILGVLDRECDESMSPSMPQHGMAGILMDDERNGEDIYYETGIDKHITQSERVMRPGLEIEGHSPARNWWRCFLLVSMSRGVEDHFDHVPSPSHHFG